MKLLDRLTKNFLWKEAACKDGKNSLPKNLTAIQGHANKLQTFRDWYNRPMKINSWYRTPAHNKKEGGVPGSQHVQGIATDIALPSEFHDFTSDRKRQFVENCRVKWHQVCGGRGAFGIYDTFMHLDSRMTRADFDYRKKKNY